MQLFSFFEKYEGTTPVINLPYLGKTRQYWQSESIEKWLYEYYTSKSLAQATLSARINESSKKEVKAKLPAITIGGSCSYRKKESYQSLSYLGLLDFDFKDNKQIFTDLPKIKQALTLDPYVRMVFTSLSGRGLKIVFHYEYENKTDQPSEIYASATKFASDYFAKNYGLKCDRNSYIISQPQTLNYDPDCYFFQNNSKPVVSFAVPKGFDLAQPKENEYNGIEIEVTNELIAYFYELSVKFKESGLEIFDYLDWAKVGFACFNLFGKTEGLPIFRNLSTTTAKVDLFWKSLKSKTNRRVGFNTLKTILGENGFSFEIPKELFKPKRAVLPKISYDLKLNVEKYLSERKAEIFAFIAKNRFSYVVAPTGSGKTSIMVELAKELAKQGKKALFLVPTNSILSQFQETYQSNKNIMVWQSTDNATTKDDLLAQMALDPDVGMFVATWDFVKNFSGSLRFFDCLIVDEAHELPYSSSYRKSTVLAIQQASILMEKCVYLTATPIFEQTFGFNALFVSRAKNPKISLKKETYANGSLKDNLFAKLKNTNLGKGKVLILLNDSEKANEISEALNANLGKDTAGVLCSKNKDSQENSIALQSETLPYPITFTTKLVEFGVNFYDLIQETIFVFEGNKPISLQSSLQFAGRDRQNSNINLTIYGAKNEGTDAIYSFGNFQKYLSFYENQIEFINNLDNDGFKECETFSQNQINRENIGYGLGKTLGNLAVDSGGFLLADRNAILAEFLQSTQKYNVNSYADYAKEYLESLGFAVEFSENECTKVLENLPKIETEKPNLETIAVLAKENIASLVMCLQHDTDLKKEFAQTQNITKYKPDLLEKATAKDFLTLHKIDDKKIKELANLQIQVSKFTQSTTDTITSVAFIKDLEANGKTLKSLQYEKDLKVKNAVYLRDLRDKLKEYVGKKERIAKNTFDVYCVRNGWKPSEALHIIRTFGKVEIDGIWIIFRI